MIKRSFLFICFTFNFLRQRVTIVFQPALTFAIERKIALVGDACSRPPITFKFHDLHASNIKGIIGEIASYHERISFLFFWFLQAMGLFFFGPFFGLPFCLLCDGSNHRFSLNFLSFI
jgi:hypothetical protein